MKEQAQALLSSETVKNAVTLAVFGIQKTPTKVDDKLVIQSTEFIDGLTDMVQQTASEPVSDEEAKNAAIDLLNDAAQLSGNRWLITAAKLLDKHVGDGPNA